MRIESDEKAREELLAFLREWGIDGSKVCVDDWDLDGYYELQTGRGGGVPSIGETTVRFLEPATVWRDWPENFPRRKFYGLASRVTRLV